MGELYEPMWMGGQGQSQGQSQAANQDDDYMVPATLPIRSSRSYDRSMSIPGGVGIVQGQGQEMGSPSSPSSASGANPSLPPKVGRADFRSIKIKGFRESEPQSDIPPLPAPPSAVRRFTRTASQQEMTTRTTPNTTPQRPAPPYRQNARDRRALFNRTARTPEYTAASPAVNGRASNPSGKCAKWSASKDLFH